MTTPTQATQTATESEPVIMPNNAVVIRRVMDRHNLRNLDLACATGMSESQISRMLSGQATISLEVMRSVWQLTSDHELIALAFGDPHAVVFSMQDRASRSQTFYSQRALASCSELVNALVGRDPQKKKSQIVQITGDCIADLFRFRNSIQPPSQHPSVGRLIDARA